MDQAPTRIWYFDSTHTAQPFNSIYPPAYLTFPQFIHTKEHFRNNECVGKKEYVLKTKKTIMQESDRMPWKRYRYVRCLEGSLPSEEMLLFSVSAPRH